MRKHLVPIALCLLLCVGFAGAQTIQRALQLSQDTTGAFSVDTNNGVYFPGHILSTNTGRIGGAASVTGTGTPTLSGTDTSGTVTMGTSATTATVLFGQAFLTAPNCIASWQSSSGTSYTITTTSITFNQPATSANKISYFCPSLS